MDISQYLFFCMKWKMCGTSVNSENTALSLPLPFPHSAWFTDCNAYFPEDSPDYPFDFQNCGIYFEM